MSKVDPSEYIFAETINADDIKEAIETTIKEVRLVSTRFGAKRVLIFDNGNKEQQVFVNSFCLQNLVEEFGEETEDWVDKKILLTTEVIGKDKTKKTIIIKPVKEVTEDKI